MHQASAIIAPAESRQYLRAVRRFVDKQVERKPQARASWGDRRLNRRKRFALWALIRDVGRGRVTVKGLAQVLGVAARYCLPAEIVAEASGNGALLTQNAA